MKLILTFEPRRYFAIPHMRASEFAELARQLLVLTPDDGPIELDQAAEELRFRAERAESRMAAAGDEYELAAEQREVEFESWTDQIANTVHGSFSQWKLFVMPGYQQLIRDDPELLAKQPAHHEKAARARVIHESLFGEDGLDFFRLEYRDRFATLAAMLRSLAKDDLDMNFRELLTPALADGRVAILSKMYEHGVAAHLRERDESRSLANHRVALRWAIAAYDHQLGTMADRHSKASCDRVNAMVKPLIDACIAQAKRRARDLDEADTSDEQP